MASDVGICNRALQKLGAKRIVSLTDDTPNARACNVAYEVVRDAELRAHPWSFAIARTQLAADANAPAFGRANSFQLPSDYLCLREKYPEDNSLDNDWQIEGRKILTDDEAPLDLRYTAKVTDPNDMDVLFREAFATKLAFELCEEITQSNSKKESLRTDYKEIIREARKANAIERVASQPPEDTWVTVRR
jgi:hypothetical protein